MKFTFFRFILLFSVISFLSSCLGSSNSTTVYSSSPYFSSLVFKTNDSIPALHTAVFTLEYDAALNDSVIINVDSLPYKTRVDSVYPTFTFKSTSGTKLYFPSGYKYKKDSAVVTGTDTIDFRKPIRVRNFAADGKSHRDYTVRVNVHTVDPEVYIWSKATGNLNSIDAKSQKTISINDKLFYYLNDGTNGYLYNSTDGFNWSSSTVNNLPVNTSLADMIQFNGKAYVSGDGFNLYSSANGVDWSKNSVTNFTFKSLLFVLNNQLWAVVQSVGDASYHFATSSDGSVWNMTAGTIPANFPVSDFAAVSISTPTGKSKVLVLNGLSATGTQLNNRWSSEDGAYWVDFSTENHTLDTLAVGASVISYDSKLFAFGLRTDNNKTYFKVSKDDGLTWQIPDTLRNILPADLAPRSYQSFVVFKAKKYDNTNPEGLRNEILLSNRIFIIGGKLGSTSYSDVWTGKLNRENFLRQRAVK